jgi:PTS system cellobiose-specific IIA component
MENENTITSDSMNSTAMEIIMLAGDARLCISKGFKSLIQDGFDEAEKNIEDAKTKLASAHGLQTEIVQSEGEGKKLDHTLLFIHAQDTLMTVFSEMNMLRQLTPIFKRYEERMDALEKRFANG